jgi:hypothetical protein
MMHAAKNLPDGKTADGFGIKTDDRYLKLNPDPLGPQHDEREPGYFAGRFKWSEGLRHVEDEAILHSSVLRRFAATDGAQHFYERRNYRPMNMAGHSKVKKYYTESAEAAAEGEASAPVIPSDRPTAPTDGGKTDSAHASARQ